MSIENHSACDDNEWINDLFRDTQGRYNIRVHHQQQNQVRLLLKRHVTFQRSLCSRRSYKDHEECAVPIITFKTPFSDGTSGPRPVWVEHAGTRVRVIAASSRHGKAWLHEAHVVPLTYS